MKTIEQRIKNLTFSSSIKTKNKITTEHIVFSNTQIQMYTTKDFLLLVVNSSIISEILLFDITIS
jgi:hypothetical protein